jgi:hypothetical protein
MSEYLKEHSDARMLSKEELTWMTDILNSLERKREESLRQRKTPDWATGATGTFTTRLPVTAKRKVRTISKYMIANDY